MLVDLLLYVLAFIARAFQSFLPPASWLPLPAAFTNAISAMGEYVAMGLALLPSGFIGHLAAAVAVLTTVNLFVLPWLAARHFRLPFGAMTKQSDH